MTIWNKYNLRMGDVYLLFLCRVRMEGKGSSVPLLPGVEIQIRKGEGFPSVATETWSRNSYL